VRLCPGSHTVVESRRDVGVPPQSTALPIEVEIDNVTRIQELDAENHILGLVERVDAALSSGEHATALAALVEAIPRCPWALHLIYRVAAVAVARGDTTRAAELLRRLAYQAVAVNRPLDAIAAINELGGLGYPPDSLQSELIERYAFGAPSLTLGTVSAPYPVAAELPPLPQPGGVSEEATEQLLAEAAAVSVLALDSLDPTSSSPIPLLSDLEPDPFRAFVICMEYEARADGSQLFSAREVPGGIWWLARGRIALTGDDGELVHVVDRPGTVVGFDAVDERLARLGARAHGPVDLLYLPGHRLRSLAAGRDVAERLAAIQARYEVHRAVSHCSFLAEFSASERASFLRRFTGYRIERGSTIVRNGTPSPGIFLIVAGHVAVALSPDGLGGPNVRMGPGEVVGVLGLPPGPTAPYSSYALDPVRALFLDADEVSAAMRENPALSSLLANHRAHQAARFESSLR
jgi:hypothetical protein